MKGRLRYVRWFDELNANDVSVVGGKNASLGEMVQALRPKGIRIPDGFATTAEAYWTFLDSNQLRDKIAAQFSAFHHGKKNLPETGRLIRRLIIKAPFPLPIAEEIRQAYRQLCRREKRQRLDVAVRSSATAEDLPEASFAGQQETFLNITGEDKLLQACRRCLASLFTDRAIAYRERHGFDHMRVALSIGVQTMVRSDRGSAGVMFSIDTETGFPDVVVINGSWGLGENVVQGAVTPDEYIVFKPLLGGKRRPIIEKNIGTKMKKMIYARGQHGPVRNVPTSQKERQSHVLNDEDILTLATWASLIERHYQQAMDMEWAYDAKTGRLYIVQARPETVVQRREAADFVSFQLTESGRRLLQGLAIGDAIAAGKVRVLKSTRQMADFKAGEILVTDKTDPDWVPVMKKAAAIITDLGGRTSHAAIVSRELGVPAVIGCERATTVLKTGKEVTVSCAEGDQGFVYQGKLTYKKSAVNLKKIPETKTPIMINLASPAAAFRWWRLPCRGVGLARMEFIINNSIKIHPMALLNFKKLRDKKVQKQIEALTLGYRNKADYFVEKLALGIAKIAASQYPDDVIVRMSDFKTNEYANLIGGRDFEPEEANPMLGFRGASRYYSPDYQDGFALECRAIRKVREEIGLSNVLVMIPFCRTLEEADRVLAVMGQNGLKRGIKGLRVYVMAEIPSNIILATEFAERFDGFSIGSNDLTQLVLGVDRDSAALSYLFDERNPAVKHLIRDLIRDAHRAGAKVGICGQAPSDYPEFAAFLLDAGIDSISLNPDTVIQTKRRIAELEKRRKILRQS